MLGLTRHSCAKSFNRKLLICGEYFILSVIEVARRLSLSPTLWKFIWCVNTASWLISWFDKASDSRVEETAETVGILFPPKGYKTHYKACSCSTLWIIAYIIPLFFRLVRLYQPCTLVIFWWLVKSGLWRRLAAICAVFGYPWFMIKLGSKNICELKLR